MSMSKYASQKDYWQARGVAAESLLVWLLAACNEGVAHPIMTDKIDAYFDAVRRGDFSAATNTPFSKEQP